MWKKQGEHGSNTIRKNQGGNWTQLLFDCLPLRLIWYFVYCTMCLCACVPTRINITLLHICINTPL